MALNKKKIVEYLEDNDLYEGEFSDIFIDELLFNIKVIKDAKAIILGKYTGDTQQPVLNEETGEIKMVDIVNPSGYIIYTNNGKTLQTNPMYSKVYEMALKRVSNICRSLGLTKKARLEIISLSKGEKDEGDGF